MCLYSSVSLMQTQGLDRPAKCLWSICQKTEENGKTWELRSTKIYRPCLTGVMVEHQKEYKLKMDKLYPPAGCQGPCRNVTQAAVWTDLAGGHGRNYQQSVSSRMGRGDLSGWAVQADHPVLSACSHRELSNGANGMVYASQTLGYYSDRMRTRSVN